MNTSVRKYSEREFMSQVIELAHLFRWVTYHTHDSRRSTAGFPDLVLVRERVIFVELKTDTGRVKPEQLDWLTRLKSAKQEAYLWRPADWPEIESTLK